MRFVVAAVAVLLGGTARADDGEPAIDADAPPPDDARSHAAVQAAVGAGSDGDAVALTEVRAAWSGSGFEIGLGARLRWRDGALVRTDWDDRGDWLGVIRRLAFAHRGETVAGAVAAGRLAPAELGAVVDGYTAQALVDRRAPGAIARLRATRYGLDAMVDDVTAPTLIAAGVDVAVGGRWNVAVRAAIDPGTAMTELAPRVGTTGMVEVGARWSLAPFAIAASAIGASGRDSAAVIRTEVDGRRGRLFAGAALEARAYDGPGAAAPFGPLWAIEREAIMPAAGDRGVATAIAARVGFAGIGTVEAGLRTRGARGDILTARIALPWWKWAQAGGYAAIGVNDAIVAGEARVQWSTRWFSAFEVGRGYRRAADGALLDVWQLSAWFGASAGW
jgi:hypothetical protein